ncbi:hypothetical protein K6T82_22300 [Flavobacterium sp. 17A]|uniref:DUF6965 domain-containing protein n=1 Tax=Flavobacterium potami TaxID=2872310 RepID=A0A9X1KSI7_9FLAO|nr:hypothetical protein [Flavobacterium potami]MBZ4037509.1 hypothetical protein [Flavobacterium potami]
MNYEDIKRHFENNPPPKEVQWTAWANITDTKLFLRSCYIGIINFNGPADRCPAWWHLRDFYILMKKNANLQAVPEETVEENSIETISETTSSEEIPAESEVAVSN